MKLGKFITFEGPDGAGKSTQIALVAAYLQQQGYEVVQTREPGGTPAAEKLREFVLDKAWPIAPTTETLVYLAARAEHVAKLIAPALQEGKVVLCDRFNDSTLVYQGVSRGLEQQQIAALSKFATGGLEPDLTVLLDAEPTQLALRRQERGTEDRMELEGLSFQEKVRAGFLALAKQEPQRIKTINALQPQEQVLAAIVEQLQALLKR